MFIQVRDLITLTDFNGIVKGGAIMKYIFTVTVLLAVLLSACMYPEAKQKYLKARDAYIKVHEAAKEIDRVAGEIDKAVEEEEEDKKRQD